MLEKYRRQLYDCSRCGFCRIWGWEGVEHVCPTYPFTPGWETQYARGRVRMARATLEGEIEITPAFVDHAFNCTLCGSCEVHCPVGLPLNEILHAWRVDLAGSGHTLPAHQQAMAMVRRHLNPYGPRTAEAGEGPLSSARKVSVLYYPGCTTVRMAEETVRAVSEILSKLGLDYAVFQDDTCCGFPLYEIGYEREAREIAAATLERIQAWRPDLLLASCPACYRMFKVILPQEMGLATDLAVQHISEFLLPLVEGRLAETPLRATWHDPCVLGRHLGMYEQPRELLRAVPGLELVEMPSSRKDALCCGAGGGVFFASQQMANQAVVARLRQALQIEAQQIVTSCPNCYVRFRQMSRYHRMPIRARDLAEFINEVLA